MVLGDRVKHGVCNRFRTDELSVTGARPWLGFTASRRLVRLLTASQFLFGDFEDVMHGCIEPCSGILSFGELLRIVGCHSAV